MSDSKTQGWLQTFRSAQEVIPDNIIRLSRTICITGGKGGVGKTSIALRFALELSRNYKVLLIDCDHNLSNTLIKLGAPLNDNFYKLISSQLSFEEALYKSNDFHLLSGCNGSLDLYNNDLKLQDIVIDIINEHKENYDFILLDSPAGVNEHTTSLASYCDDRIFVVTPDKSSITDAYSLMKVARNRYEVKENHMLVNKTVDREQFNKVVKTVCETADSFLGVRVGVLGAISYQHTQDRDFDKEFLSRKNNLLTKTFVRIIKKYTDRVDGTSCGPKIPMTSGLSFKHEVQSLS